MVYYRGVAADPRTLDGLHGGTTMRCAVLATTVVLTLTAGGVQAAKKSPKPDVGAGRIAWFDITTTKMQVAKDFYSKLFGWKFNSIQGTDLAAEIVVGETSIGTLRVAEGRISAFDGVVYVQVNDLPACCEKAKELGGTIPPGFPFNLGDGGGAIGLVTDPCGHPVGMYSRTSLPSATPAGK
jgi:predicted enzyme related to lactoylglutathione lyase